MYVYHTWRTCVLIVEDGGDGIAVKSQMTIYDHLSILGPGRLRCAINPITTLSFCLMYVGMYQWLGSAEHPEISPYLSSRDICFFKYHARFLLVGVRFTSAAGRCAMVRVRSGVGFGEAG